MLLLGWGKHPLVQVEDSSFETISQLTDVFSMLRDCDCIAYGKGRSYGDSALNERVIFTQRFNKILEFNSKDALVR